MSVHSPKFTLCTEASQWCAAKKILAESCMHRSLDVGGGPAYVAVAFFSPPSLKLTKREDHSIRA